MSKLALVGVFCSLLVLGIASCGDDDKPGTSGGDPTAAINEAKTKYGCPSSVATPCNFTVCQMLAVMEAYKQAPYWNQFGTCIGNYVDCFGPLCSAATFDQTAAATCGTNLKTCSCAIPEYKSAAGTACD